MANKRPLRYGGVMNSGFPTPPPGVFDDERPGWTNNAAAPSAAFTHAVKPEPYSPPRMATPTAPAMSETLTQRKREVETMHGRLRTARKACALRHDHIADTAIRAASQGLRSQCHRAPYRLRLASHPDTRRRSANNTAHLETAKHRAQCTYQQACARAGSGTPWAQLAADMSLESLVILGDATLTAIARKPSLSGGRTADEIYQDLCGRSANFRNSTRKPHA